MKFTEMLCKVRAEYNEDQPRDDGGQWTSGGGGGGGKGESDKGGGKSKKDFSDYDDWDPSDDYSRPDEYPGKDAPKALKEKLVKNSDRRLAVAEKEVAKAKKPIEKLDRRVEDAQKKADEELDRFGDAETKAGEAEDALSEAEAELEEAEENDAPAAEIESRKKDVQEKKAEAKKAERERAKQEAKSDRAAERVEDLLADRSDAEDALDEAMSAHEQELSWNDLHKADLIEDASARDEEIDDLHRERERNLAHAKAKRADADRRLKETEDKIAAIQKSYTDERGLIDYDKSMETQPEQKRLRLEMAQIEREQRSIDLRIKRAAEQVQFWKTVKEGGDLSDYWGDDLGDTDDEPEGTAEDRDGDGRTGEAEERDDDRDE